MKRRFHVVLLLSALCCGLLAPLRLSASYLDDIGYTALAGQLGPAMPTGAGITVEQIEASLSSTVAVYLPDPSAFPGQTITDETGGGSISTHATTVGCLFYGSGSIAPGISQVDAYLADDWLNNWLHVGWDNCNPPAALPANLPQVANASWVGTYAYPYDWANTDATRRLDYAITRDGTFVAVAVNNAGTGGTTPQNQALLAGAYNVISVGLTSGSHNYGPTVYGDGPGRIMPDIVVPQNATSYATPLVSGAAAMLLQVAATSAAGSCAPLDALPTDPAVLKTILMAGANKNAVSSWVRQFSSTDTYSTSVPLDPRFGAGQLNVCNAYQILTAGAEPATTLAAHTLGNAVGWNLDSISQTDSSSAKYYLFNVPQGAPNDFSAIVAWNRMVDPSQFASTSGTAVFLPPAPALATIDLQLYQLNPDYTLGALVDQSASAIDNVQGLFQRTIPAGTYALQVTRADAGAVANYAIAWQLTASTVVPVWNGGGGTAVNFTLGANWGGGTPTPQEALTFGPLAAGGQTSVKNDFASYTPFGSLTFQTSAAAYTLQGNPLALAGPIINQSASPQTIALDVQWTSSGGTIDPGSGGITISGAMSGAAGLMQTGSGTLTLAGSCSYAGGTTVASGVLVIGSASALPPGGQLVIGDQFYNVGDSAPTALPFSTLVPAADGGGATSSASGGTTVTGALDSAPSPMHTVPEPAAWLLLLAAGAGGFTWIVRKSDSFG